MMVIVFQNQILNLLLRLGFPRETSNAIIGFVIFVVGVNLTIVLLSFFYRKRKKLSANETDNVILGLQNVFYILLAGAIIITLLAFFGIDLVTLFTSLSIVAAAIAIVTKDYLNEIISGIIITFSRDIAIGDYVKIGEQTGSIIDLNLSKVAMSNDDEDIIFIPNHKVFMSEIINYTKRQIKKVNIPFEVDIKFLKTIEELEHNLIQSVEDYHEFIEKDSFNLRIAEIKKDQLVLKFQYTLYEINRDLEREIRRKTVRRVVNFVKSNHSP